MVCSCSQGQIRIAERPVQDALNAQFIKAPMGFESALVYTESG
jgi:hypothetical protein